MKQQTYGQVAGQLNTFNKKINELASVKTINAFYENKKLLMTPLTEVHWVAAPERHYSDSGNGQSWIEEGNVSTASFAKTMKERYGITLLGELFFHDQTSGKLLPSDVYEKNYGYNYPLPRGESSTSITNTYKELGLYKMKKGLQDISGDIENMSYEGICGLVDKEKEKNHLEDDSISNPYAYGLSLIKKWELTPSN